LAVATRDNAVSMHASDLDGRARSFSEPMVRTIAQRTSAYDPAHMERVDHQYQITKDPRLQWVINPYHATSELEEYIARSR
jgi:hypothetical protein